MGVSLVRYSAEGFRELFGQVSGGAERRHSFGWVELLVGDQDASGELERPETTQILAAVLAANNLHGGRPSITTLEFLPKGNIHTIRRALLSGGELELSQGSIGLGPTRFDITPELSRATMERTPNMTAPTSGQADVFQRIATVALQLTQ